jgi:hypothetical protein
VGCGWYQESSIITKFAGKFEIEDLKTVKGEDSEGNRLILLYLVSNWMNNETGTS